MADAKIKESERLRRALKISKDYEEGSHWKKQEERLRESVPQEEETRKEETREVKESRESKPRRTEDQEEGEVSE